MIRRPTPENNPYLKDMQQQKKPVDLPKRRGYTPTQTVLSVQDVRDYSTPAGAAQANEEMRRLRLSINEMQNKVEPAVTTDKSPIIQSDTPKQTIAANDWALTVKHNTHVIGKPKIVQSLDFRNPIEYDDEVSELPIRFQITENELEPEYSVINKGSDKTSKRERVIRAYARDNIKSGIIEINQLPLNADIYDSWDAWKTEGLSITPANGYYGWYVYNIIDHGWILQNLNDWLITLVDLHNISIGTLEEELENDYINIYLDEVLAILRDEYNNPDYVMSDTEQMEWIYIYYTTDFAPLHGHYTQVFFPEIEGRTIEYLDTDNILKTKDIVLIHGMYKPGLYPYRGGVYTPGEIEYIDEANRIVRTNIIFHYVLRKK